MSSESKPEVPFCAAAVMTMAVVLARRSAPEWVRPAASTTPAVERGSACCSAGAGGLARLLLLLRPERHFDGRSDYGSATIMSMISSRW